MSIVTIRNVEFLNNPARFTDPYRFRVTFECLSPLPDDLEWKLIYVSCPENAALDQEIDSCLVGPVPPGVNSFEFQSPAPDHKLIPEQDLLGVAALILTGSYAEQEFVRVGYYQNTEYEGGEEERLSMEGKKVAVERLVRDITKKPRVTRFQIKWDVAPPQSTGALGAATSAAVPSADSYGDDDNEKDQMDVDTPTKSNGNIPIS
ncbi:anti-silence-domain-containing protein [Lentinula edodes]|nr:ASF1 like histone chaperone-domain-containing protein [Lentinula edodes]KAJ3936439.1 MAG: anti-silence-domain-containing protein [Lentinula lateritia]KAH7872411.1 ASF1 like histone chaperone-domain-containing protein [Lentinula edodes]KAJ3885909.1 anti-silence-domain-containing protein [Lentinula edodes]KAJ3900083.1 anti-silence-domain-containing protein [Lentinula edodes]KAJ3916493.1 anti-silence-domain-containing protein [Lentinula edodes]